MGRGLRRVNEAIMGVGFSKVSPDTSIGAHRAYAMNRVLAEWPLVKPVGLTKAGVI